MMKKISSDSDSDSDIEDEDTDETLDVEDAESE